MKNNIKQDYIKAVKKGERDARLENQTGFTATTKVWKNKKKYSRKNYKISFGD